MGRGLARESGYRRHDLCPVCRRSRGWLPAPGGRRAVSEGVSGEAGEVRVGSSPGQDAADSVWARSLAEPETGRAGGAPNGTFLGVSHNFRAGGGIFKKWGGARGRLARLGGIFWRRGTKRAGVPGKELARSGAG